MLSKPSTVTATGTGTSLKVTFGDLTGQAVARKPRPAPGLPATTLPQTSMSP